MKWTRKSLFKQLTGNLAICAAFAFLGKVLATWAISWLIAMLYLGGLVIIFLTTREKKPDEHDAWIQGDSDRN